MAVAPSKALKRLLIIIPILFLLGFLTYSKDKVTGLAVIIAGVLVVLFSVLLYYFAIKKKSSVSLARNGVPLFL